MLILQIFLALWWIWLPALLIWLYVRNKKRNPTTSIEPVDSNNQRWLQYIASFSDVVKSKAEKHLIYTLLEGKSADQLYGKPITENKTAKAEISSIVQSETLDADISATPEPPSPPKQNTPIDNTLILLYFGAFLLVASAGLFVALSDVTPQLRTILVAITAGLLYVGGLWIYQTKRKLMQAGLSFIGTGMVIAPLTGVAWYNLINEQSGGALVWFVTSLLCLGLYTHAFLYVKNSLIPYLLIGSFVSTVESVVLVGSMPHYLFAWVAIILGLVFQLGRSFTKASPLEEAQDNSAQALVPLSILGSLVLMPDYGSFQLAVTLVLAGVYYALLAFRLKPEARATYSPAAQLSIISGVSNAVYGQSQDFRSVMFVLAAIGFIYAITTLFLNRQKLLENSIPQIAGLIIFIATAASIYEPIDFTLYLFEACILGIIAWLRFTSKSVMQITGLLLIGLPFAFGQYALNNSLSPEAQTILCALPVLISSVVTYLMYKKTSLNDHIETSTSLLLLGSVAMIGTSVVAGFSIVLITTIYLLLSFVALQYLTKDTKWWAVSSVMSTTPFFYTMFANGFSEMEFVIATAIVLCINIVISLITREELVRWILAGSILMTPVALGSGGLEFTWQETGFSITYVIAMLGLVFARSIARGKLFVARNVPLSSYDKNSSTGFTIGYILAGIIAVIVSLSSPDSQVLTTAILAAVTLIFGAVFYLIENEIRSLAIVPILIQLTVISGLRPDLQNDLYVAATAVSLAIIGAFTYFVVDSLRSLSPQDHSILRSSSLLASFSGVAIAVFSPDFSPVFPISLTIAGALSLYHYRNDKQGTKELSAALIALSFHWILYLLDIRNIHVHTHLATLLFAGFAWWRMQKQDTVSAQSYIKAAFIIATAPLALQALSGSSGEFYGLALIVQQVAFMAVGVALNQKFLLKAGLWVALASVLYQLRGLGWAFLSIVAAILIGYAIYRLQKHDDTNQPEQ